MDVKIWFSASELSLLGERFIAGLPTSMRGNTRKAQREGWLSREVKGGGGPGGILTEYQPPAPVLDLIKRFLDETPDFFKSNKKRNTGFRMPDKARQAMHTNASLNTENEVKNMPISENDISRSIKMAKETAIKGGLDLTVDQRLELALYIHNQLCDKQLDKAGFLMGMLDLVNKAIDSEPAVK